MIKEILFFKMFYLKFENLFYKFELWKNEKHPWFWHGTPLWQKELQCNPSLLHGQCLVLQSWQVLQLIKLSGPSDNGCDSFEETCKGKPIPLPSMYLTFVLSLIVLMNFLFVLTFSSFILIAFNL